MRSSITNVLAQCTLQLSNDAGACLVAHAGLCMSGVTKSILAAALLMAIKEQLIATDAILNRSIVITAAPSKDTVATLAALSAANK